METSDSEYFESADEDFESDVDDPRHKSVKTPGQDKVIEPELCKLKLDDKSDPPPEPDVANPTHNPNKAEDPKLKSDTEINDSEVVQSSVKVKTSETPVDTISEHPKRKSATEVSNSELVLSSVEAKAPTDTISESPPQTETPPEPKVEEDNLWDDDELDWGSEAAKETVKQAPSGWDDFDALWDSQTSQSQTVVNSSDTLKQSSTQENLWQDDGEWEPLEKPPTADEAKPEESSWGGWGGWGVTSLLSTATQSVTTLTSQVSHVLENSIGIPQPEELAKITLQQEQVDSQPEDSSPLATFGLGSLVKFVESTGTKVISGGLDTLEAIGKKTVEVLQDGDPGLKKKRAFLKLDTMGKPNLSQILREAKEKAEQEPEKPQEAKKVKNYETLFDDHQGLVHLEALEMLSRLCSIKLDNLKNSLSGDGLQEMQETLEQVKELCELSEDDDDCEKVTLEKAGETVSTAIKELDIPITYAKFFNVCEETNHWLNTVKTSLVDDAEIHQQAMDTLAQLTAICMEQFHKAGELLMVKEHRSTADEADSLVQITTIMKRIILEEAEKFTEKLSSIENADKDRISDHITNIFFEAGNSSTYIQNAFQLLIPVLQVGAV